MKIIHIGLGFVALFAAFTVVLDWYLGRPADWATRLLALAACIMLLERSMYRAFPSLLSDD